MIILSSVSVTIGYVIAGASFLQSLSQLITSLQGHPSFTVTFGYVTAGAFPSPAHLSTEIGTKSLTMAAWPLVLLFF